MLVIGRSFKVTEEVAKGVEEITEAGEVATGVEEITEEEDVTEEEKTKGEVVVEAGVENLTGEVVTGGLTEEGVGVESEERNS